MSIDIDYYNQKQAEENQKQIALDFDDVIHKNSKGFFDGTVYDEPVDGAEDALKLLTEKGYDIVIFTAKAKPDRPLVNGKTGAMLIWDWLEKHNLKKYIKQITSEKPRAKYYVDDKAVRFDNWNNVLKQII